MRLDMHLTHRKNTGSADVGNMMEERMVLEEIADSETGEAKQKLLERISLIDAAVQAAYA